MDFLPRYLTCGALACALGLVSLPAFAGSYSWVFSKRLGAYKVYDPYGTYNTGYSPVSSSLDGGSSPDSSLYSWRYSSGTGAYKVYDPQGAHLSSDFTPNSSFAENSASDGVIEYFDPQPLVFDGAGNLLSGVSLSRGLSIGDLVDGVGDLLSDSNPYGLAIMAGAGLLGLLTDAYQASPAGSSSSSSPPISSSNPYFGPSACSYSGSGIFGSSPMAALTSYLSSNYPGESCDSAASSSGGPNSFSVTNVCSRSFLISCSGTGSDTAPSGYGGLSVSPPQMETYFQNNPSEIQTEFAKELAADPQYQQALAEAESNNPTPIPLPTPSPYTYDVPTPDQTITGSPTTTTSTDPTTNTTTTTTTTPSYDISGGPDVTVTKTSTTDVQTCTSAGSCTTTTTITKSNPQPKAGTFIPPSVVPPSSSPVTPTPFSLSLAVPNQSTAVCPSPLSYSAFGQTFNISVQPLCTLATNARPYVEALGAVGAGIVIFH
jgi:hypothetical protein